MAIQTPPRPMPPGGTPPVGDVAPLDASIVFLILIAIVLGVFLTYTRKVSN